MVKQTSSPITDFFVRIKNAVYIRAKEIEIPYSRMKYSLLEVLKKEGYIKDFTRKKNVLLARLAYKRRKVVITDLKNISKGGLRVYRRAQDLVTPLRGEGLVIVSTSKGVMSGKEAKKKGLGGEVLAEIW